VGAVFELGLRAQEIVDALRDVLGGVLILVDHHHKMVHAATAGGWYSRRDARLTVDPRRCRAEATIHDRWILMVLARKGQMLPPDADLLVDWAAVKLSLYMPARPDEELPHPPRGDGGGSSGSAELGIPVWWARRARD
jgi:hypothetical protein